MGAMCATQARPGLNSTPHSRKRRRPQRETIFCGPLMRKLTSFSHTRRRSRLAATPCGVSVTGRGDDGTGGRGGERRGSLFLMVDYERDENSEAKVDVGLFGMLVTTTS